MTPVLTESMSRRLMLSAITRCIQAIEVMTRPVGHRGYWHLLRIVTSLAPHELACVDLEGTRFYIYLDDPYWARILGSGFCYEQEIHEFLDLLEGATFDFIDGGANIGYWTSVVARRFSQTRVVAVEPNESVFTLLSRNTEGTGADLLEAALTSSSNAHVTLYVPRNGSLHTDSSLLKKTATTGMREISVVTVSVMEILKNHLPTSQQVLLKLDVEGLETEIVDSLQTSSHPQVAIIYEEHGSDASHNVSRSLLSREDYTLFFLSPGLPPRPIWNHRDLDDLKRQTSRGYNCLAVPLGGPWSSTLAGLVGR